VADRFVPGLGAGGWRAMRFVPFREGVEICRLAGDPAGASTALLRYRPGASVPLHEHPGLETILVLEGSQSDELGDYPAGSFVANPAGSRHAVRSEEGCVVLIQWERPVRIIGEA